MNVSGIDVANTTVYASAKASKHKQSTTQKPADSMSDSVHFSAEALRLMKAQRVSEEEVDQFAQIIRKARTQGGYADSKRFLSELSPGEMEVLRKAHGLANPIAIDSLDFEGAYNLLLPHDEARDLNNDALLSIGAGKSFTFPPPNAPESAKQAWEEATSGLNERDKWLWEARMFGAQRIANIHRNDDGSLTILEPGDAGYRSNIFAEPGFSYQKLVKQHLEGLEFARNKGFIDDAQYRKDKAFLHDFGGALRQRGVA